MGILEVLLEVLEVAHVARERNALPLGQHLFQFLQAFFHLCGMFAVGVAFEIVAVVLRIIVVFKHLVGQVFRIAFRLEMEIAAQTHAEEHGYGAERNQKTFLFLFR